MAHGRVAFADWLKGYGLIVILDHGEGWMSLYADDSLQREVGEWWTPATCSPAPAFADRRAALCSNCAGRAPVDPRGWFSAR